MIETDAIGSDYRSPTIEELKQHRIDRNTHWSQANDIEGGHSMSTVIERIGQYVAGLKFEDLPEDVTDYAKSITLDSLACAYGGLENEPARMVRDTVQELSGGGQATIFGKGTKA
ncbi:MAG: MmgE/PrpD family protein, partial [Betaproteobacteria bacterium]|nr:MmgE/PrpD family protein [Betaproteobacteria bacterium]